jgi:hypothetical protein
MLKHLYQFTFTTLALFIMAALLMAAQAHADNVVVAIGAPLEPETAAEAIELTNNLGQGTRLLPVPEVSNLAAAVQNHNVVGIAIVGNGLEQLRQVETYAGASGVQAAWGLFRTLPLDKTAENLMIYMPCSGPCAEEKEGRFQTDFTSALKLFAKSSKPSLEIALASKLSATEPTVVSKIETPVIESPVVNQTVQKQSPVKRTFRFLVTGTNRVVDLASIPVRFGAAVLHIARPTAKVGLAVNAFIVGVTFSMTGHPAIGFGVAGVAAVALVKMTFPKLGDKIFPWSLADLSLKNRKSSSSIGANRCEAIVH